MIVGLLLVGLGGVALGTGIIIYSMLSSFEISISFWMSLGLVIAICSLTPFRAVYAHLAQSIATPSWGLSSFIGDEELKRILTRLTGLLVLLALLAWTISK